jgi:hypothetical protein
MVDLIIPVTIFIIVDTPGNAPLDPDQKVPP